MLPLEGITVITVEQAVAAPILREVGEPEVDRILRRPRRKFCAVQGHCAGDARSDAVNRLSQLGPPGTHQSGKPDHFAWQLRNHIWGTFGPKFGHDVEQSFSNPTIRYGIIDTFNAAWRLQLETIVSSDNTIPGDQIIDYPDPSNDSRYTFSLFAFPEDAWPVAMTDFYKFCNDYYKQTGYRSNLLYVGYYIAKDQKALLSYSWDTAVMTIDPVSTGNTGWDTFIDAYNQFCIARGALPLPNQTPGLTPAMLQQALGSRLQTLSDVRKQYDPTNRMLNSYFSGLLP